jgi:hypothetical protein
MSGTNSKSVSFEEPRAASVSSSTKSIKAESLGPYGKKHYVSVCINQNLLNPKANRAAVDVLPEWALV